jgi:hypothetical protein
MTHELSRRIFEKYSNIQVHQYHFSGSPIFRCGGQTGMTKVMVAFRNFGNEPKNGLETDETCEQSEGGP